MENNGRHIAPSSRRLAAAAKAGLFARSPLFTAGVVLVTCALMFKLTASSIGKGTSELVASGFSNAFETCPSVESALLSNALAGVNIISPLLITCLIVALISSVLLTLIAKRKKGRTAVPLPKIRTSTFAKTVFAAFSLVVCGLIMLYMFKSAGPFLTSMMDGNPSSISEVTNLLLEALAASGLIMMLTGVGSLMIDKVAFFKALQLNRSEARAEARALEGGRQGTSGKRRGTKKEAQA